MTLSTESIFLTNDAEGFRECREKRTTASATMTVMLCKAGFIDVFYHGKMIRINPNDLWVRIPDHSQQLGPYEMSPDFQFEQVTISAAVFEKVMYDHMRVEPQWYAKQEYVKENPIFHMNPISMEFFDTYFHLLTLQLKDSQTDYRRQILMHIAHGATMEMLNYIDKLAVITPAELSRISTNKSDYISGQRPQLSGKDAPSVRRQRRQTI